MTTLTIIGLIILAGWGWAKSYIRGLAIKRMHGYAVMAEQAVEATLEMRDKQYNHIYSKWQKAKDELEAAISVNERDEKLLAEKDMYLRTYKIERNQFKEEFTRKDKVFYELLNASRSTAHSVGQLANMTNVAEFKKSIESTLTDYTDRYEGRKKYE